MAFHDTIVTIREHAASFPTVAEDGTASRAGGTPGKDRLPVAGAGALKSGLGAGVESAVKNTRHVAGGALVPRARPR